MWHVHPADHVDHCTRCGMRLDDMPLGDVLTEDTDLADCAPAPGRQVEAQDPDRVRSAATSSGKATREAP